jgi:hypothetical protein
MKLNKLLSTSLLGFSLLTTSAFACEHSNNSRSGEGTSWSLTGWFHNLVAESHRECDQNGQDSGRGNNCDRGKGNGGGYCGTGGSTGGSTGGTTGGSTGGGTTGPKG